MTLYSIIHGPEVWLVIAQIAIWLATFNAGLLAGMFISALLAANGEDEDEYSNDL